MLPDAVHDDARGERVVRGHEPTGKAEAVYRKLIKAFKPGDVMVERLQRGRDLPVKKHVA